MLECVMVCDARMRALCVMLESVMLECVIIECVLLCDIRMSDGVSCYSAM